MFNDLSLLCSEITRAFSLHERIFRSVCTAKVASKSEKGDSVEVVKVPSSVSKQEFSM